MDEEDIAREEAIARANGRMPRATLERDIAEFEAVLQATRASLIAAEALREHAEEELRLERKERRRLETILEESINYRGATLRELKDERERADLLVDAGERVLGYAHIHDNCGPSCGVSILRAAIKDTKRARAEQSIHVPVRIGPPLEFNGNDDLRIDSEDE
jgi:hypothetical protein